ncbi:uncharacterized protein [Triticum aestivum]|uniref:uncharacterized protein n=1 Tax=Triticum aestivum TaxID=4565 RepID=UPI001D010CE3|nr:uncharacterized protein LOC123080913 [Triticum aestivum]
MSHHHSAVTLPASYRLPTHMVSPSTRCGSRRQGALPVHVGGLPVLVARVLQAGAGLLPVPLAARPARRSVLPDADGQGERAEAGGRNVPSGAEEAAGAGSAVPEAAVRGGGVQRDDARLAADVNPGKLDPMDNHISFQCEDMGAMEKRLKEMGIRYMKRTINEEEGSPIDQLFFNDPDGFMIEICNCENLELVPAGALGHLRLPRDRHNPPLRMDGGAR